MNTPFQRVVPTSIRISLIGEDDSENEELLARIVDEGDELLETPSSSSSSSMLFASRQHRAPPPKQNDPEGQVLRRLFWGSADSARLIGGALASLGIPSAHHRVLRSLSVATAILKRTPRHKEAIGGVPCRIYRPSSSSFGADDDLLQRQKKKLPVIIYLHGGGWCMGSTKIYHPFTLSLCRDTGAIVVSVEYRLAPEHPYPAPVDDCLAVTRAILNADKDPNAIIGSLAGEIDVNRVVIAGDSAGGNLSGVVALELIRLGQEAPRLRGVVMICPVTQIITAEHPSCVKYAPRYSKEAFGYFVSLYAGVMPTAEIRKAIKKGEHLTPEQRQRWLKYVMPQIDEPAITSGASSDGNKWASFEDEQEFAFSMSNQGKKNQSISPSASSLVLEKIGELATTVRAWPLLADDEHLAQMPPTLVQTCSHDALRDENIVFYERLKRSGAVDVRHSHIERAEHCEALLNAVLKPGFSKASSQGYSELMAFFKEILYDDDHL